ncbi:MAG: 30S ribosomal protein S12 methylthiotransferase RimO [Elusimicrobiaceae bacterium]
MAKIFVISLGCPKNLTDTEEMLGFLGEAGHEITPDENAADAVLLNTCAFIQSARDEAESEIRRLCKLKRKGIIKRIIVAGCLVQRAGKPLTEKFPEVDSFLGIGSITKIAQILSRPRHLFGAAPLALSRPQFKIQATAPHSAYLKIADGCNNRCSYCTIPAIRGPFRSKPSKDVLAEARQMAKLGVKEISVIAQDTTSYGVDLYGKPALLPLLKKLVKIGGVEWVRLMYVYPEQVSAELLNFMAKTPKMCRYLDMPLQHIADNILSSMKRRSSEALIREKIALIRKTVPGMAIRTNFIVGYPGETEKDFEKLEAFVRETEFDNVGVFTYFREKGTSAAQMKKQISAKVKQLRAERLVAAQSSAVDRINRKLKNQEIDILLDTPDSGRSHRDAPDIDGLVEVISKKPLKPGSIIKVKITGAQGYLRTARAV